MPEFFSKTDQGHDLSYTSAKTTVLSFTHKYNCNTKRNHINVKVNFVAASGINMVRKSWQRNSHKTSSKPK